MLFLILATLCAFFIKGLCGFANTLIFTSILSFQTDNINISPMELILGYPSNAIMAFRERKALQAKIFLPLTILVILGSLPGIFLLKNVDTHIIKIIFGFLVILISIEMLFRERSKKRQSSKLLTGLVGLLAGVLCGLYGIGVLLAAYLSRVTENTSTFRANLCLVFLLENTFRIVMYAVTGIITIGVVKQAAILYPFMIIGLFLGIKSNTCLNEQIVKKVVVILLLISGMALILNNLT